MYGKNLAGLRAHLKGSRCLRVTTLGEGDLTGEEEVDLE